MVDRGRNCSRRLASPFAYLCKAWMVVATATRSAGPPARLPTRLERHQQPPPPSPLRPQQKHQRPQQRPPKKKTDRPTSGASERADEERNGGTNEGTKLQGIKLMKQSLVTTRRRMCCRCCCYRGAASTSERKGVKNDGGGAGGNGDRAGWLTGERAAFGAHSFLSFFPALVPFLISPSFLPERPSGRPPCAQ